MKHITIGLVCVALIALSPVSFGQIRNEGLAKGMIAARKKDAGMLQEYNWNCRTEILKDGNLQDLRVNLVSVGPDGQPQRTRLSDEKGPLQGGPFRKAIEKNKRKELEDYVRKVSALVDQYTFASAGKVIDYMSTAQITPETSSDGKSQLQLSGSDVVIPGDSMTMTIDGATLRPTSLQINTTCDGDSVNISATFAQIPGGPAHVQYATVQLPDKNSTVMIHNYDYVLATPPPPPAPTPAPAAAAGGALPVGTTTSALPAGFQTLNVNGSTYYQSGPNWYKMEVGSNGVYYIVVQAP